MINIEDAYQSLKQAKIKLESDIKKNEEYEQIYYDFQNFSNGYHGYMTIDEFIARIKRDNKNQIKMIFLAALIYVAVFGLMDLISFYKFGNSTFITSSIGAGSASFIVATRNYFKTLHDNRKTLKRILSVKEKLKDDPKFTGKSLTDIIELILIEKKELVATIKEEKKAIIEYEDILNKANECLAEEILASSGIEASVNLNSKPKTLTLNKK